VLFEGVAVFAGAVAFVACEAVVGVGFVQFPHEVVAGLLGDDAGGGDGEAAAVAFDHGLVSTGEAFDRESVDEREFGEVGQGLQGFSHGEVGGVEDVDAVDFPVVDDSDTNQDVRKGLEGVEEFQSSRRRQEFGVGDIAESPGDPPFLNEGVGEHDRRGHHGTGKGAAAGLVDPGHTKNAALESGAFGPEQAGPVPGLT